MPPRKRELLVPKPIVLVPPVLAEERLVFVQPRLAEQDKVRKPRAQCSIEVIDTVWRRTVLICDKRANDAAKIVAKRVLVLERDGGPRYLHDKARKELFVHARERMESVVQGEPDRGDQESSHALGTTCVYVEMLQKRNAMIVLLADNFEDRPQPRDQRPSKH
eukprot:Amastigsp_a3329_6.p2 type:complete len:163 gc:universal Amastigsp_a3329_6:137-625(+)